MPSVMRVMECGSKLGAALALTALVAVACDSDDESPAPDGSAGAIGQAGTSGTGADSGTGGKPQRPWNFGEPLISERGDFSILNHDHRLIVGTSESLFIEEGSSDLRVPFTVEFFDTEEVSVETIVGEPYKFHGKKAGSSLVKFRATDSDGDTVDDAFRFEVEEPVSMTMGACEQVLGGSGTDVSFFLNDRIGFRPQGLLPVEVSPPSAAQVDIVDGYMATRFQVHVAQGFVGTFELKSTLPDGSSNTLRAVSPVDLEPPRIFGKGTVGIGNNFTVAVETWTADGVVCSPIPVTLVETAASDCRVLRRIQTSFYEPFERPKYELVGEVIGGICEVVAQYDQAALEAILGVEGYAALPENVRAPLTIKLDIELVEPSHAVEINTDGGSGSSGGGGWD